MLESGGSPETLAVLRIVVAISLLGSGEIHRAVEMAALPIAMREAPLGYGWIEGASPPTVASVAAVAWLLRAALLSAALGLFARLSMALVAATGVYVLGVPQMFGDVLHMHHLLWCAAILACAPCGDALGADAWLAARHGGRRAARRSYAAPLVVIWLVLSLVYFFPGIHKLRVSGLDWITGPNIEHRMHEKWWMSGQTPALRIDRWPALCRVGAAGVVLLELLFPLLAITSARSRTFVAWAGMAFHALAAVFLQIRFGTLIAVYVAFFDWRRIIRSVEAALGVTWTRGARRPTSPRPRRSTNDTLVAVAAPLVVGIVGFGAAGEMRGWPFACYPTFASVATGRIDVLRAVAETPDGREIELWVGGRGRGEDTQRWWSITTRYAKERPGSPRLAALAAETLERARSTEGLTLRAIRLQRATYDVTPERADDAPVATALLYELKAAPPESGSGAQ